MTFLSDSGLTQFELVYTLCFATKLDALRQFLNGSGAIGHLVQQYNQESQSRCVYIDVHCMIKLGCVVSGTIQAVCILFLRFEGTRKNPIFGSPCFKKNVYDSLFDGLRSSY